MEESVEMGSDPGDSGPAETGVGDCYSEGGDSSPEELAEEYVGIFSVGHSELSLRCLLYRDSPFSNTALHNVHPTGRPHSTRQPRIPRLNA
jgi:hypothetical protein